MEACMGIIRIGSFQEKFSASLMYWKADEYKRHWSEAIARIISSNDISALITSMVNPENGSHIFWWPMYRIGKNVFFQNHILFFDQLASPFDESNPFIHVPQRMILNEDGERISEWVLPINELKIFWENNLHQ